MSIQKLKVAEGLLTGCTYLRTCMFKFGLILQQDCRLYRDKNKIAYILYVFV
jgi:hypothetical protein